MKIGIDARFALHQRRGIGNYTLQLIHHLSDLDTQNEYVLYTDQDDINRVLPRKSNFVLRKITPASYPVWEQVMLPLRAAKDAIDILHCTGNTAPIYLDRRIKLISTIHDVMFLKDDSELPKSASLYQRAGRFYRKVIVPKTIARLSMVLTVSEFSKRDIMHHIRVIKDDSIKVTHEAASKSYRRLDRANASHKIPQKLSIRDPYVLTLGALDPRKNTESVIRKFIELKAERKITEKLVIVGVPHWRQTKFYQMVHKSAFADDFLFTEFLSEEELAFLYSGAKAFLYPSSYEGFGIPLLEAMACGVPVITSNTTSIPEVVGNAALLIDPLDGEELKSALLKILNEEGLREVLISRGLDQAKKFSWIKTAKETLLAYESVYQK